MISPRKLIKIARKWQKITAMRRKGISFSKLKGGKNTNFSQASSAGSNIFRELFKMFDVVFGLPSEGPIKLPCDAVFMECTFSLIQKGLGKDIEKALLTSMETTCSPSLLVSLRDI
ncbi:hypothetical protein P3X46_032277 [Hevea brasiliensis]|uniref:Auxin-responsive protein n=1 Tax=Hevea brasiliensis TaxID=3981 RepID=A0ABQ9KDU7_HEVBR|nr:hypothetical protein P3X46_032277 [Hevea brasiliensis]